MLKVSTFILLIGLFIPLNTEAFEHYDPIALNESAIAYIREGNLGTALILLERAARLDPYNERILSNLRELKAQMKGTPLAIPAKNLNFPAETSSEESKVNSDNQTLREPPDIWKTK